MDLRQLECFVAVADDLHFGRAAERLHIGQPSVSEQIRRLERDLGEPLFLRTSRRVELTSLGELLLPDARRALEAVHAVYERGREVVRNGPADVRVGLAADIAHDLLGSAIRALRGQRPELRVNPISMRTPDQVTALLERRLEVGLCWEPPSIEDLVGIGLGRESYVVLVRTDHPFAGRDEVPLAEVAREPLVMFDQERNPWTYQQALALLSGTGEPSLSIIASGAGIHGQIPHVIAGYGIAVSVAAIAAPVNEPDVVVVTLEAHVGPRRVALRHAQDRSSSTIAVVEAFAKAAIHCAER